LAARREGIAEGGGTTLLVAPIYAAMPREQQMRVFEPTPEGARKVCHA
jgi:ATP-dependent RNA helicase DHX8/PRP22